MTKEIEKWNPDEETTKITLSPYTFQRIHDIMGEIKDEPPTDENSRIETMKNLHIIGRKAWWLIGELLFHEKKILEDRYSNFLKQNLNEKKAYTEPRTLIDWCEVHAKELGFSYKTALRYMNARINSEITEKVVAKLGASKLEILKRAGEQSTELIQRAMEENWTRKKCEDEIQKITKKHNRENALIKAQKTGQMPRIDVRRNDNTIIIKTDKKYADELNDIIISEVEKWKKTIYFETNIA